ncbi:Transferase family protein [Penicillium ucsense]|uniref:Transferase family protein n=1 Tax=Penicillium ucsense TaxID=2839758 RepID=A0A8J8WDK2_9EURO|nr:Transferase family protein [Penicillium ucsense]KAF7730459.1 Transferase family protein [Penicillium ucsense]
MVVVTRQHEERIFPLNNAPPSPEADTVVPLSLLDATTANFSVTGAIWFLEKEEDGHANRHELNERLKGALAITLKSYPQCAGRLELVPYDEGRQFGRLQIRFNCLQDPGVDFITAGSHDTLDDLISRDLCHAPYKDMHRLELNAFTPPTELAAPLRDDPNAIKPAMAVQMTQLACGGTVLAVKMAHPLGDAHTLATFVNDWARVSRVIAANSPLPNLSPLFDPSRLDTLAAGDLKKAESDSDIIRAALNLPLHRYDWWTSADGSPWPIEPPGPFKSQSLKPAGNPMPWSEWDVSAPVSHFVLHFTPAQVQTLRAAASSQGAPKISTHDAVVAHIWSGISRARHADRGIAHGPVHCDLVYGLRDRLCLGADFVGCPHVMLDVAMDASIARQTDIAPLASEIRSTLTKITPDGLKAHLHSIAYEDSPQRIWQAFLGDRHILVTSWAQNPVYTADFGTGLVPRYVEAIMPDMDGTIQIKQGSTRDFEARTSVAPDDAQPWYKHGVDVSLHLRSSVMEKLLEDTSLFP